VRIIQRMCIQPVCCKETKMNILLLTHSASLRSTTCVLDALIKNKTENQYTVACSQSGTWIDEVAKLSHVEVIAAQFNLPSLSKPFQFLNDSIFWVSLLRKHKIDVIHVNEHEIFTSIRYAALVTNTPVVSGIRFILNHDYAHWLFGGKCKIKKAMFTSHDQYKMCISEFPEYLHGDKSAVIGNGRDYKALINAYSVEKVNSFKSTYSIPDNSFLIGTASSIRPRKRIEDFVDLVAKLSQDNGDIYGVIAGGGKYADADYEQAIKKKIIDLGLSNRLIMTGNLDDLSGFYSSIDMFVSTSELETFGMSVSEAMAMSVPTIGYTGGSVQEVIGNPWCIANNGNIDALVSKAKELIEDPVLYKEIQEAQKNRIMQNFDAPILAEKIETIYREVLHP
jgi:glycosyltransferase involved in cell wall biosynthesis